MANHHGCGGTAADADSRKPGLTIYGCGPDEARLFRLMASRFDVMLTITPAAMSEANVALASGNRCISIGHKTRIENSTLLALSRVGVQYVSTRSIGYDHIDVRFAERVGISVENVMYSPDGVADYTLMLMLMLLRHAKSTLNRVRTRDYRLHDARGRELRDMTIGVVGTGRIGTAVIGRLQGFGCGVMACDRGPGTSAGHPPLDAVLEHSDIVTLHAPLCRDTHHLLNRDRLDRMKQNAYVINTGRGSLVDTEALLCALESGHLAGAALDVVEGEEGLFYSDRSNEPVENELLWRLQQLPNVLITPHTAYYTDHVLRETVERTLVNCRRFEGRAA
jgi:D-specific alpha-keto acid dehydrogenase